MKSRGTVFVSLVVALLVLGVSAGSAGAISPMTRAGAHNVLKARAAIASFWGSTHWTNVYGVIRVENLTPHTVRANCRVTLFDGYSSFGGPHFTFRIRGHAVRRSNWFVEVPVALGSPYVHAACRAPQ